MGRSPCCSKEGMNRGAWTALEDKILTHYIKIHGEGKWRNLPKKAGQQTSTSTRGHLKQSNEKKMKKPMIRPPIEAPPSLKMDSLVVRTKALRCTEISLPPQPHKVEYDLDIVGDSENHKTVELETRHDGLSSITPDEGHSTDFMTGFNMEELCLSNLLDVDFSQPCELDCAIVGDGNKDTTEYLPSSDQPLLSSEEMLEAWTGSDSVQPEDTSDLRPVASFLDSLEEWLGE
ncbi:hypothetical protein HHK36_014375 [Tetracentron sinense]|uniref:Uncharacterized protein n=1 Tax=Tetracentron sinense TaxID=13715 RepID=A0A835DHN2_TETSI|nr:hypothetical protein HHK36_014375 [Tetracentron sinense]